MPAHQDRRRRLLFDLEFADLFDEPFLRFGPEPFFGRQPVGIAPELIGFGDSVKQIRLDLSCQAPERAVADRVFRIGLKKFARLQVIADELNRPDSRTSKPFSV